MPAYTYATSSSWVRPSIRRHANITRPGHLRALLSGIVKCFSRNEDIIVDRYSGCCSWGDETERRLLNDVFNGKLGSFFN